MPAEVAPAPEVPSGRACVVVLGGRSFAVDVTEAREVVALETTTPVPGAPASVVGVMNLRGSVLPIVEARPLLGLPVGPRGDRALVLAHGEHRAAVVVERVVGLTGLEALQPPSAASGELAVGELNADTGGRATLLDARAMLAAIRRGWDSTSGG